MICHVPCRARAQCALLPGVSWKGMIAAGGALALLLACPSSSAWASASVDDLTGPWQLFVDDYPVANKSNVVRTYHAFQKYTNNPVMVADQPWEGLIYLYGTVLPNETHTGYRMWYHTLRPNDTNNDGSLELYATSTDGIHWTKPILNLRSWHGSTANNMYFTRPTTGGMVSTIQTPWDPDPNQLYKLMNYDVGGFFGGWSPDGIHVTDAPGNPVFTGGGDVGQFCWDPHTQQYLGYVKGHAYVNGLQRRCVSLTTTTNITTWPTESLILQPDAIDDRWVPAGTLQCTHLYGMSAFAYESMYIGLLWIFRATDPQGYYVGTVYTEVVSSHDGVNWTREEGDRPPILPLGTNSWDNGQIYTARAPIVEGGTIKLWYGGFAGLHGSSLTSMSGSIGLATMRKDGFASLDAGATAATILTKNLIRTGGPLAVNYQAVGGSLKVEVLDQNNNVLPGYSQADCAALTSDSVNQAVSWAAHTELPAGMTVLRLRFILQNASLYSFMAGSAAAVADAPAITQQPASSAVLAGGTATFSVTATGSSPLSYQWQKNQANLADGGHYSGCATATLTITGAATNDAASYRCVVTNMYGSVIGNSATLKVITIVFGAVTLTVIPTLAGDTINEGRAIAPDGRWVVGVSGGARGFLYQVNTTNVVNVLSADNAQSTILTGVGYRTNGSQQEILMTGLASGWQTAFMTTDGIAFANKLQTSGTSIKVPTPPVANGLAGSASSLFYSTWSDNNTSGYQEYAGKFSGAWPTTVQWDVKGIPKNTLAGVDGVSSTGRAVGWRGTPKGNYALDWNGTGTPTPWFFNGLDGTTAGEAFSVSAYGTNVFGQSPVLGGRPGRWGYKTGLAATMPGPATQLSTSELANFPDTAGTNGSAAVPYGCTPDGKYAVGMSYRGVETAVLWDTSDPNPAKWTVLDLMKYAAAQGVAGTFTSLTRAYSAGFSAAGDVVITGIGISGGATRAFLMTVPTPIRTPVVFSGSYPGGLTFTFPSLGSTKLTNYLEYATSLSLPQTWNTVTSTQCTGNLTILSDPNPPDRQRFYRIRIQ